MIVNIAFLRGINVGGQKSIKMDRLKGVLNATGLCDVQTYIQSGNVLFKSNEEEATLQITIRQAIETAFGFSVPVMIRTAEELNQMILKFPFSEDDVLEAETISQVESAYICLLASAPSPEKVQLLDIYRDPFNHFQIIGRDVFLLFHQSIRKSQLTGHLDKLGIPSTIRNWKTINQLAILVKGMGK